MFGYSRNKHLEQQNEELRERNMSLLARCENLTDDWMEMKAENLKMKKRLNEFYGSSAFSDDRRPAEKRAAMNQQTAYSETYILKDQLRTSKSWVLKHEQTIADQAKMIERLQAMLKTWIEDSDTATRMEVKYGTSSDGRMVPNIWYDILPGGVRWMNTHIWMRITTWRSETQFDTTYKILEMDKK